MMYDIRFQVNHQMCNSNMRFCRLNNLRYSEAQMSLLTHIRFKFFQI